MLGKSRKLADAETEAIQEIKRQAWNVDEPLPVTYPLHVTFLFYRKDKRHTDLSNLYEFPQDCLQKAGIIENDCQIESHDGSRKLYDKDNPRTEIYIERFQAP
jgi:Holliday junction resolvase RusA-like endonuclease